jgi:hypothetical protein
MTGATTRWGIVVGVDGSSSSNAVVEWAACDAPLHRVPLTVVHALLAPEVMTRPEVPLPPAHRRWQEAEGRVTPRRGAGRRARVR